MAADAGVGRIGTAIADEEVAAVTAGADALRTTEVETQIENRKMHTLTTATRKINMIPSSVIIANKLTLIPSALV